MLILIVILLVLNLIVGGFLFYINIFLKKELFNLKKWCNKELDTVIEKENELDVLLDAIIYDIESTNPTQIIPDMDKMDTKDREKIYGEILFYKYKLLEHIKSVKNNISA